MATMIYKSWMYHKIRALDARLVLLSLLLCFFTTAFGHPLHLTLRNGPGRHETLAGFMSTLHLLLDQIHLAYMLFRRRSHVRLAQPRRHR